jgi:hypothetical protein
MGKLSKNGSIKTANEFAAKILIPRDRDPEIASLRAKADVIRLADELKISPGIAAGHFQRLTKKWNYFNVFKRKFQWTAQNHLGIKLI